MPDRVVSSSKLTAIANAIRAKAGTQSSMTLDEMPTAIANIPGGGGGAIDLTGYDGQSWNAAVAPRLDTSGMTDMSRMFYYQTTATSIDVSGFDTSNVTNMARMFGECSALTSLDLGSFNTSQVTDMSSMFADCYVLTSITNLSRLTTSNVTTMQSMFSYIASKAATPVSLDLSTFRTSNVTTLLQMFSRANLQSLDLDNWDTSNVTTMQNIFYNAFNAGGKIWVPSTFVSTQINNISLKPFYADPGGQVEVYTDATDATSQGWGTPHANYVMHYNSTHQDFINDVTRTVTIIIPATIEHSGGTLIQRVTGSITSITLSPQDTYRIDQSSGTYNGISVTVNGNNRVISGTPTGNVILNFTATQNPDILTSDQKNFANWVPYTTYYAGFDITNGVSSSAIPWRVLTSSGTHCEGYCYGTSISTSTLPLNVPYQFSLTYKVDPAESGYNNTGCYIGLSATKNNGYIKSNMLGSISIAGTQTEYITSTVNITRTSGSVWLAIVNSNWSKTTGLYAGKIYIQEMTLREI